MAFPAVWTEADRARGCRAVWLAVAVQRAGQAFLALCWFVGLVALIGLVGR